MRELVELLYLLAAVLFIVGIMQLTRVKTAARGNVVSAVGMLLAVATALLHMQVGDPAHGIVAGQIGWPLILGGLALGTLIGAVMAYTVRMTAMPEMVAIFNGFGGGASVLVALAYFVAALNRGAMLGRVDSVTVMLSVIIGSVTFTGSVVAFAKLRGLISGRPILFKGNQAVNGLLGASTLAISAYAVVVGGTSQSWTASLALTGVALALGVMLVLPIGGADMPVVIALLNSYSGLAASATGFVLKNSLLIVSGALVGASGVILTQIMCKAMNRSLTNVLFGGVGAVIETKGPGAGYKNIKESSPEELALLLENAGSVVVVPGYGLAVAQAQHAVQELGALLQKRGVKVAYGIHPVAGRMPGHMNVLLAEASVPYEQLAELEQINPEFPRTDVVIVVGANDVVNPAAAHDKGSPIYGMPILNVHEAKAVFVVKRSLSPGFSGVENELFDRDNTWMLFGDAKKILQDVAKELKDLA